MVRSSKRFEGIISWQINFALTINQYGNLSQWGRIIVDVVKALPLFVHIGECHPDERRFRKHATELCLANASHQLLRMLYAQTLPNVPKYHPPNPMNFHAGKSGRVVASRHLGRCRGSVALLAAEKPACRCCSARLPPEHGSLL